MEKSVCVPEWVRSGDGMKRRTTNKRETCFKECPVKKKIGTSLVVQWLRILFLMQGTRVQFLVGELRYHMCRATKPAHHKKKSLCGQNGELESKNLTVVILPSPGRSEVSCLGHVGRSLSKFLLSA